MSKILGNDGSGFVTPVTQTVQSFSNGAFAFAAGYVPLFNGNITSFNLQIGNSVVGASSVQVCLYLGASPSTGGATLIATSSAVTPVQNTLINLPITPTAVLTTNTYTMFISTTGGTIPSVVDNSASAFVVSQYNSTHFPFATPPGTTFNPRDAGTGREPLLWADGNSGGPVAYSLVGQPGQYAYQLAPASAGYGLNGQVGVYAYSGPPAQLLKNGQPFGPSTAGKGRRRFHRYT